MQEGSNFREAIRYPIAIIAAMIEAENIQRDVSYEDSEQIVEETLAEIEDDFHIKDEDEVAYHLAHIEAVISIGEKIVKSMEHGDSEGVIEINEDESDSDNSERYS